MSNVEVTNITYADFIKQYHDVRIPDYQRPYRWDKEKVQDLLEDFQEFFIDKPTPNLEYYIGGILLYHNKKENCHEIIDGQQRLTTLNLISNVLNGELQSGQDYDYNNYISFYHIIKNHNYISEQSGLLEILNQKNFFDKLSFTLIISNDEDQSFAFFDSQNNRGVTLAADDYLKAYHLREIHSESLQEKLAVQWEEAAIKAQNEMNIERGLLHLFYKILYRSRKWKGQSNITPENRGQILSIFQKQTIQSNINSYRLFKAKDNVRFSEIRLDENQEIKSVTKPDIQLEEIEKYPFSIRQPLYKGLNFFQFTQKYYAIHQLLFYNPNGEDSEIQKVRNYYDAIYNSNMSEYLRHYMQLCMVMYYDTFGGWEIDKAVQYFDYFIGSIRIEKHYVRREAIKNSLTKKVENNLLDVIAHSYLPEEVFDFIKSQSEIASIYEKENLESNNGVRSQYKNRVIKYYDKNESRLQNRIEWIK